MILVVDTSSSLSVLALIDHGSRRSWNDLVFPSRDPIPLRQRLTFPDLDPGKVERVAVATGPGSFTGLRRGAAFALGLALGLRVPIVPLPTLDLQAARGGGRLIAVSEAGRGRFYILVPGGQPQLAAVDEIPKAPALVGLVAPASEALLAEHGLTVAHAPDVELVAKAAEQLLETAPEVGYESLKLDYMQSFSVRT